MITNASSIYTPVAFSRAELRQKEEGFKEKLTQAQQDGFFYVEIPEGCREKIEATIKFGNQLRTNDALKSLDLGMRLGYQERHGTQAVAFCAMKNQWEDVYPGPVKDLAEIMNQVALDILKISLEHLSIPSDLWSPATGELTDDKGSNVFSVNSYQQGEQKIGLIPHKDMGWITVLFIDKVGLETSLDGKNWTSIPPKEGYFVINFGKAFELLINSSEKLRASVHRVRRLEEERLSFGIFINHSEGTHIHQINGAGKIEPVKTYEEYLSDCFSEFQHLQTEFGA